MVKAGDIIEWRTLNGYCRGTVEAADNEEGYIVRLQSGAMFTLEDLRHSLSAKLIKV